MSGLPSDELDRTWRIQSASPNAATAAFTVLAGMVQMLSHWRKFEANSALRADVSVPFWTSSRRWR